LPIESTWSFVAKDDGTPVRRTGVTLVEDVWKTLRASVPWAPSYVAATRCQTFREYVDDQVAWYDCPFFQKKVRK